MTATNMCYNFVGFGCSPPYMDAASPEDGKYHTNRLFSISAYTSDCKKNGI